MDTGLGMGDVRRHARLPLPMRLLMRTRLDPDETALRRLASLGLLPRDVRHIVLSHLDFDHAGGIEECVRDVQGLPPEILLVPLPGHTPGHCGIAIRSNDGWLFHTADAYFHHDEIHTAAGHCPAGLRAYQSFMESDRAARLHNRERLRELVREHVNVRVICSHDVSELEQFLPPPAPFRAKRSRPAWADASP